MLYALRRPPELLGMVLALVIAVVVHSLAQAAAARATGDRLPAANGRLNPDPRRHIEAFGVIVMVISGVGWNKAVPLQEPRFRNARTRYVLAVLAGPVANLLVAALSLVALHLVGAGIIDSVDPRTPLYPPGFADVLLFELAVVNAAVGVLTLFPIPPLDGARLLWLYAPKTAGWRNARYQLEERNIGVAVCIALMLPLFGGTGLLMSLVLAVSGAFLAPIAHALGFLVGF